MIPIIPSLLKKKITFKRLPITNCLGYEIYGRFKDDTYASGIRIDLIEYIENPVEPTPKIKKIELEHNISPTWKIPNDAYIDRDHRFFLYQNGFILTPLCYAYNKVSKLVTIDVSMKPYDLSDVIELEYYQDIVEKEFVLEENCEIIIKPIFKKSSSLGEHNVII